MGKLVRYTSLERERAAESRRFFLIIAPLLLAGALLVTSFMYALLMTKPEGFWAILANLQMGMLFVSLTLGPPLSLALAVLLPRSYYESAKSRPAKSPELSQVSLRLSKAYAEAERAAKPRSLATTAPAALGS